MVKMFIGMQYNYPLYCQIGMQYNYPLYCQIGMQYNYPLYCQIGMELEIFSRSKNTQILIFTVVPCILRLSKYFILIFF